MKKFMNNLVMKKRTVIFEPADNMHHYIAIISESLVVKEEDLELS